MDKITPPKWFIILNKSPRGPFFENEIKELLQQGLVRHNDLALLVEDNAQGTWKFLWQYPEFDSRLNEKSPPPPDILEKRKPRTTEEIQKELEQEIPLDLKTISLEDLIIRAKPRPKRESELSPSFSKEIGLSPIQAPSKKWMKLAPLFLFLVAIAGMIFTQKSVEKPIKVEKVAPPRIVASDIKKLPPTPRKIIGQPQKNPAMSVPQERDRGEVREEEILRLRQAERLKELEEKAKQEREKELERKADEADDEEERGRDSDPEVASEDNEEDESREEDLITDGNSKKRQNKRTKAAEQEGADDEEEPSWWLED